MFPTRVGFSGVLGAADAAAAAIASAPEGAGADGALELWNLASIAETEFATHPGDRSSGRLPWPRSVELSQLQR